MFLNFSPDYSQGKFAAASEQCFSDYNLGWQLQWFKTKLIAKYFDHA